MKKMIAYQAMQRVAQNHNVPFEEVQSEISNVIQHMFPDSQIPTPEEFVAFLCGVVCSVSKER